MLSHSACSGMEPMIAGGLMATGGAIVGFFLGQFAFKFGWSLSNKTLSDRMNEVSPLLICSC